MLLSSHSDRINAVIGFRINLLKHLRIDLGAGYAVTGNQLCDVLVEDAAGRYYAVFGRYDNNTFHADFSADWLSERFCLSAKLRYANASAMRNGNNVLDPSALSANLCATYNIGQRVYFGLDLEGRSDRKGLLAGREVSVPGFVNLGLHGEYKVNRTISVWLKGGNLLGQGVYTSLLHIRRSPDFTVGLCVNL